MANKIFCVLLFFIFYSTVPAGENPPFRSTGNPNVDFFGAPMDIHATGRAVNSAGLFRDIGLKNKKEKSPAIAGLLSLAVPGAGEIYAGNYLKGAIFFTVEVASWVTAAVYDKKGDDQTALYKNYANAHYSAVRYAEWVLDHLTQLNPDLHPDDYRDKVFFSPDPDCPPPFSCLNWKELNKLEEKIAPFTHRLPFYGEQQYYELIGKYKQFSKGWDSQIGDETDYLLGNQQFFMYGEMFNKADKYYKVSEAFFGVIIVNHILSALDAVWTAANYNSALQAQVRMEMHGTPYGFVPVAKADLHYIF